MSSLEQTPSHIRLWGTVSAALLQMEEPEQLFERVFRHLYGQRESELCLCYLAEDDGLRLVFFDGLPDHLRAALERLGARDEICGKVAFTRRRTGWRGIQQSGEPATAFLRSVGVQAFQCYPLLAHQRLYGVFALGTRKAPAFSSEELEVQGAVADGLALALDRMMLQKELTQSREALLRAQTELQRAHSDFEQFLFSASHDLREPLRHLILFADLLQTKAGNILSEDCLQYLSVLSRSAQRMQLLIRDLVAYLQAGAPSEAEEREIDTNEALAQALSNLNEVIRDSAAIIHIERLPAVRANSVRLVQLFQQLIDNALKFRRPGTPPEVHIFTRDQDGTPVFCVRDNGIGISPEYSRRVFGLFKRLHTNDEYEGTGAGLAICHKIVDGYGGHIWVESQPGAGATFCFTLGKRSDPHRFSAAAASRSH
jgi:signal transduction histidine kinase